MKKEFMSILLIVSMACVSSTYTAEAEEEKYAEAEKYIVTQKELSGGEVNLSDDFLCNWILLRSKKLEGKSATISIQPCGKNLQSFIISPPDGKSALQISPDRKLNICDNEEKKWLFVENKSSEVLFDSAKQGKDCDGLDHEEIDLSSGASFFYASYADKEDQNLKSEWIQILAGSCGLEEGNSSTRKLFLLLWLSKQVELNDYKDYLG